MVGEQFAGLSTGFNPSWKIMTAMKCHFMVTFILVSVNLLLKNFMGYSVPQSPSFPHHKIEFSFYSGWQIFTSTAMTICDACATFLAIFVVYCKHY